MQANIVPRFLKRFERVMFLTLRRATRENDYLHPLAFKNVSQVYYGASTSWRVQKGAERDRRVQNGFGNYRVFLRVKFLVVLGGPWRSLVVPQIYSSFGQSRKVQASSIKFSPNINILNIQH